MCFLPAVEKQCSIPEVKYVNATDNEGNTALHLAVQNGNLEVTLSLTMEWIKTLKKPKKNL